MSSKSLIHPMARLIRYTKLVWLIHYRTFWLAGGKLWFAPVSFWLSCERQISLDKEQVAPRFRLRGAAPSMVTAIPPQRAVRKRNTCHEFLSENREVPPDCLRWETTILAKGNVLYLYGWRLLSTRYAGIGFHLSESFVMPLDHSFEPNLPIS